MAITDFMLSIFIVLSTKRKIAHCSIVAQDKTTTFRTIYDGILEGAEDGTLLGTDEGIFDGRDDGLLLDSMDVRLDGTDEG